MSLISPHGSRSILLATALYFATCGLSALFLPASWLWASGLPTELAPVTRMAFGVIGAYLCSLAVGALIARMDPYSNGGLIFTLFVANVFDFAVTFQAILRGQLPAFRGSLFLVIAIIWATLLSMVWLASRRRPQ